MREILFRGRDKQTNNWVYGDLVHNSFDGTSSVIEIGIRQGNTYPTEVKPETVGQFTGLLDKNGDRIFEGDIVEINHPCWSAICETLFQDGAFFFIEKNNPVNNSQIRSDKFLEQGWKIEIIRNIHENEK